MKYIKIEQDHVTEYKKITVLHEFNDFSIIECDGEKVLYHNLDILSHAPIKDGTMSLIKFDNQKQEIKEDIKLEKNLIERYSNKMHNIQYNLDELKNHKHNLKNFTPRKNQLYDCITFYDGSPQAFCVFTDYQKYSNIKFRDSSNTDIYIVDGELHFQATEDFSIIKNRLEISLKYLENKFNFTIEDYKEKIEYHTNQLKNYEYNLTKYE